MHRNLFSASRVAAILALGSAALVAQGTQTASITGEIRDEAKAPVAAATIRLTSPSMQGSRTLTTDEKGRFATRLLPPGTYAIEVWKTGFQKVTISERLGIDQNYQPTITLAKAQGAVVEVIATASTAVDKTDVKTATNYSLDKVDELPTASRSIETMALLTPGVTVGVGSRVQIRGAMTSGNLMLLDGQNVEDNAYNTAGVTPIEDAIEETQIITGAISAEYGNVDGGVMNSITRSGSNTFTGQIRWEMNNPAWNATKPYQNRTALANYLGSTLTYSGGGFIIKDKLWFFLSYYGNKSNGTGTIGSDSASADAGVSYPTSVNESRRQLKLTYQINENHSLVGSFMNMTNTQGNRNYSAGELAALVPQKNTNELINVAWRAVWNPTITSEIRVGSKKQMLSAGGAGTAVSESPIYDDTTGYYYNMGIFDANDGGDHRENRTANIKVSMYLDAAGSHQVDMGFDYYRGIRRAKNGQTPTGYLFEVDTLDPKTKKADGPFYVYTYELGSGESHNTTYGLYLNDKWTLDKNFSFQIGLRFDKYQAESETGERTAGATGFSPRLGMKWDVLGDSKWVAGLSFSRYNGKVLEGILNQVTTTANPKTWAYSWSGSSTTGVSYADLTNLSNYNMTSSGLAYYEDPTVNVKLASGLKAPHMDELQASLAYSFQNPLIGTGFVRLTTVSKVWKDLIDYSVGNNGTVNDSEGFSHFMKVWDNNPDAKRKYKDLEFDASVTQGKYTFAGNITWSSLKGNYEGEGTSTPSRGEGINAWNVVNGVTLFDKNWTAPYGYLSGHVATRMRWTLDRSDVNSLGKYSIGFVYRFDTGQHYSATRSVTPARMSESMPSESSTSFTQYKDQVRGGGGIFPSACYLDLAIRQDFEIFKVGKIPVNAFAKIVFMNFLNHQQIIGWNTVYASATGDPGTGLASTWKPSSTSFGLSNGSSYYGTARTIYASAGIKF